MACCALLMASCNPARRVQEGEVWLRRNNVIVSDEKSLDIPSYQLEDLVRPKANRRTLVFRFNLWAYNQVNPDRQLRARQRLLSKTEYKLEDLRERLSDLDSTSHKHKRLYKKQRKLESRGIRGWRDWLRETIGEPPALVDDERCRKTTEYLEIFLAKHGYFRNDVSLVIDTTADGRKADVNYYIRPGPPFLLDSIHWDIRDTVLAAKEGWMRAATELKPGERFDVDVMNAERERITKDLTGSGYYGFSKEFIQFEADSTLGDEKVRLTLVLHGIPTESPVRPDSIYEAPHDRFFIRNINIYTDYTLASGGYVPSDTLEVGRIRIYSDHMPSINPELIFCTLNFAPGDRYAKARIDQTYRRFLQLDVFDAVNMRFDQVLGGKVPELDVNIYLDPGQRHSVTLETRGTHRDGNLGVQTNLAYRHRNLFSGAERASARLRFGLEAQQAITTQTSNGEIGEDVVNTLRFNTFEIGPEFTLSLPRLFPLPCDVMSRSANPQSDLTTAFNYQLRPDYERNLWQIRYGVHWIENIDKGRTIYWDLPELSVISIAKSEEFQAVLDDLNDDFLSASYNDHLILSTRFSVITNNQNRGRQRTYAYKRFAFETAGFSMHTLNQALGGTQNASGGFEIAGIQYAQFLRGEYDFRVYRRFDEVNSLAVRVFPGIGYAYGNLLVLPFEKSFFAGGANGIRAWQARTLGPGAYQDPSAIETFNNIGDFRLEGSIEYRFKFTSVLELALFADAGNVWLLRPDDLRPGADLNGSRFASEIAVGSGLGVRLDFEFFLLRFDFGLQLKDPAKVPGERWLWEPKDQYRQFLEEFVPASDVRIGVPIQFNLGIGYPF